MSMKDAINTGTPIVDQVNEAIRQNPLAAGLIGAGLAWMVFGTKGFGAIAGMAKNATGKATSAAVDAGSSLGGGIRAAAKTATTAARDVVSSVGDQAASIVPDVNAADLDKPAEAFDQAGASTRNQAGASTRESIQSAVSAGREYGQVLQSRLSESLERQPLLLGAIGLAVGAGIASTFATTAVEREWLGEQGDAARTALKGVVDEAKDRVKEVVSEVQQEASRQGLTRDGAKEAASTVAEKMKNLAGSATEAAKKPFASTR
jgi:hypothetical protein